MAKQPPEKRKTLTLNPETHKKLRIYAAKTGRQMMDIMDNALSEYIKKKKNTDVINE